MIHKQILVPDRVRRPPTDGWSWIDRRFLREHAPRLSHEAMVLYFFLAAVSDKDGLSFYGDASIALRLRMAETVVVRPATSWWRRIWWPTGAVGAGALLARRHAPASRRRSGRLRRDPSQPGRSLFPYHPRRSP